MRDQKDILFQIANDLGMSAQAEGFTPETVDLMKEIQADPQLETSTAPKPKAAQAPLPKMDLPPPQDPVGPVDLRKYDLDKLNYDINEGRALGYSDDELLQEFYNGGVPPDAFNAALNYKVPVKDIGDKEIDIEKAYSDLQDNFDRGVPEHEIRRGFAGVGIDLDKFYDPEKKSLRDIDAVKENIYGKQPGFMQGLERGLNRLEQSVSAAETAGALENARINQLVGLPDKESFYKGNAEENVKRILDLEKQIGSLPQHRAITKATEAATKASEEAKKKGEGTVGQVYEAGKAFVPEFAKSDDKTGAFLNLMGEQAPVIAATIAGTKGIGTALRAAAPELAGTAAGTAIAVGGGSGAASYATTFGPNYSQALEKGLDPKQAVNYARRRSAVQALVDAGTGAVVPVKIGGNQIINIPAQTAIQMLGGGGGEYLSAKSVGEEAGASDILVEGVLEAMGLPGDVAGSYMESRSSKAAAKKDAAKPSATQKKVEPLALPAPTPTGQFTTDAEGNTREMTLNEINAAAEREAEAKKAGVGQAVQTDFKNKELRGKLKALGMTDEQIESLSKPTLALPAPAPTGVFASDGQGGARELSASEVATQNKERVNTAVEADFKDKELQGKLKALGLTDEQIAGLGAPRKALPSPEQFPTDKFVAGADSQVRPMNESEVAAIEAKRKAQKDLGLTPDVVAAQEARNRPLTEEDKISKAHEDSLDAFVRGENFKYHFDDIVAREGLAKAKQEAENIVKIKPAAPTTLSDYVREQGGIKLHASELGNIPSNFETRKAFKKNVLTENGLSLDDMALQAWEAGYFPDKVNRPTTNQFLELLQNDMRGKDVLLDEDMDYPVRKQAYDEAQSFLNGFDEYKNAMLADAKKQPELERDFSDYEGTAQEYRELERLLSKPEESRTDNDISRIEELSQRFEDIPLTDVELQKPKTKPEPEATPVVDPEQRMAEIERELDKGKVLPAKRRELLAEMTRLSEQAIQKHQPKKVLPKDRRAAKAEREKAETPVQPEAVNLPAVPVVTPVAEKPKKMLPKDRREAKEAEKKVTRKGVVGGKLSAGERVLTVSGRETTPFPDLKFSKNTINKTLKNVDSWLMENAALEAESRGDEYNARMFRADKEKPQQADKDSAEMYLFDDASLNIPVVKSILKPLSSPKKETVETAPKEEKIPSAVSSFVQKDGPTTGEVVASNPVYIEPLKNGESVYIKANKDAFYIIALDNKGDVLGDMLLTDDGPDGIISIADQYVKEGHRRKGVNTAMARVAKKVYGNIVFGSVQTEDGANFIKSFQNEGREVKPTTSKKETVDPSTKVREKPTAKIEDFGEKIGNARKDVWKERALQSSDLNEYGDRELADVVKKDRIFPTPDYAAMADMYDKTIKVSEAARDRLSGSLRDLSVGSVMAMMVKQMRDAIPNPVNGWSRKQMETYTDAVNAVRDAISSAKTWGDFESILTRSFGNDILSGNRLNTRSPNYEQIKMLGNKFANAAYVTPYSFAQAAQKVMKTGFPRKTEQWEKSYEIVNGSAMYVSKLRDIRNNKDTFRLRKSGYVLSGNYDTEQAAEAALKKGAGDFHLFDKKSDRLIATYPTEAEAKAAAVEKARRTRGGVDIVRPQSDLRREGKDYRQGKDVTTEKFMGDFGFKGGEFGNWLNDKERQQTLNYAYDGLMDLAGVLGVPPGALSLNGELSIAFGARGKSKAAAHYEPGRVVVNLTKMNGAGALAHEWAHAVDDYFGRLSGSKTAVGTKASDIYASYGLKKDAGVRPEMVEQWKKLVDTILRKQADKEAIAADQQARVDKSRKYAKSWTDSMRRDLVARKASEEQLAAFDAAVADVLNDPGSSIMNSKTYKTSFKGVEAVEAAYKQVTGRLPDKSHRDGLNGNLNALRGGLDGVAKAMAGELKAVVSTDFVKAANKLDEGRSKPYWGTIHELFARSFESYVQDKITKSGDASEYLVSGAENKWYLDSESQPYPEKSERDTINKAFDDFFKEVKTEKDASTGKTKMYSVGKNIDQPTRLLSEGDVAKVATGKPVTFNYIHNKSSATKLFGLPRKGDRFGRDLEPSGKYLTITSEKTSSLADGIHEGGVLTFKNPLVIPNDNLQWKRVLSEKYGGKTGKALSKAIISEGYDGVITTEDRYISEILDLTSFEESKALYSTQGFTEKFNKNLDAIKADILTEAQRINPDVKVEFVDQLFGEGEALLRSGAKTSERQEVAGAFTPVDKLIEVSLDTSKFNPQDTAYHELWHSLEGLLTPQERKVLQQRYPGKGAITHEEQAAIDFARVALEKRGAKPIPAVIRAFNKIKNFLGAVKNALKGRGFNTAESIFEKAYSGDLGKRIDKLKAERASGERVFSISKDDQRKLDIIDQVMDVSSEKTLPQKLKEQWENLYIPDIKASATQGILDQFHVLKLKEKERYGALRDATVSAYKRALMTQNLGGVMATVIGSKYKDKYRGGALKFDKATNSFSIIKGSKSLLEVLDPITHADIKGADGKRMSNEQLLKLWKGYAIGKRAERLYEEGRERNVSQSEIGELISLEKKYPMFKTVFEDWQVLNKQMLQMATDSGILSKDQLELFTKYGDYVPFYRVMGDTVKAPGKGKGLAVKGNAIKRLTGGISPVGDIIENLVSNMTHLTDLAYRNVAMTMIDDMMKDTATWVEQPKTFKPVMVSAAEAAKKLDDIGVDIESLTEAQKEQWLKVFTLAAPTEKDVVSFMVDGKLQYRKIDANADPLLLRAVSNLNHVQLGAMLKVLGAAKRTLTHAVTVNPVFMMRNAMRDTLSSFIMVGKGLKHFKDAAKGFNSVITKDDKYMSVMAQGAGAGGFYSSSPDEVAKLTNQLARIKTGDGKLLDTPKKLFEAYKAIGQAAENQNRLAVFDAVKADGGSDAEAAFQAMDLMNFTMRGDYATMRTIIATVPFINARLQGLYRLYRGAKGEAYGGGKGIVVWGGALALASVALAALNAENDDYDELEEWQKDAYYHIFLPNDIHLRLPKPFEIGALFSTIPERMYRSMIGKDSGKIFAGSMGKMFLDTFAMNPMPQGVKPLVEDYMNKSFFTGNAIVPQRLDNLTAELQYDERTSRALIELADAMPDVAPELLRSPKRMEALVRGYTAEVGMSVLWAADKVATMIGDYPERSDMAWDDAAVIGAFLKDSSNPKTSKYVQQLYDARDAANKAYASYVEYAKYGDKAKADKYFNDNLADIASQKDLNKIGRGLTEINKEIRAIEYDKKKSGSQKKKEIQELTKLRLEVAKKGADVTASAKEYAKKESAINEATDLIKSGDYPDADDMEWNDLLTALRKAKTPWVDRLTAAPSNEAAKRIYKKIIENK